MLKLDLQQFGGRGAGSGLDMSYPGGGGSGRPSGMDAQPGMMDSASAALGAKGRPMSTTSAVKNANPMYNDGKEYQYNCQRCVVATEARMRGYDVQALPTFDDDTMPMGTNYLTNFKNAKTSVIKRTTPNANRKDVESQMKEMGDGSRAAMSFTWSGGQSGHVINVVQRNGKTRYFDGQDGTEVSAPHLFNAISRSSGINLTRIDNLDFSDTVNQAVRPRL